MAKITPILHKRSSEWNATTGAPKLPDADSLRYGEIAVNYAAGREVMSFKNSDGQVVGFGKEVVVGSVAPTQGALAEIFVNESGDGATMKYKRSSDGVFVDIADTTALANATANNGVNAVTSLTNVPVTKRLVIATLTGNASLSLAETLPAGGELHIIITAYGADRTITLPNAGAYRTMDGRTSLVVNAGEYADINILSDGTTMFIRAL